jgi:hypothetical protein
MAPIKGESQLEKAERLRLASRKLEESARFNRVSYALKTNPAACTRVEVELIKEGLLDTASSSTKRKEPEKEEKKQVLLALPDQDGPDGGGGASEVQKHYGDVVMDLVAKMSTEAYDRNHSKYGHCGVKLMEAVLTMFNKITYSPGNLRSMISRGKRMQNKSKLWELIELNTQIGEDDPIPPNRRCDRFVAEDLLQAFVTLGKPGDTLALPPTWDEDGVYDHKVIGAKCTLTNKLTKEKCVVDVPRLAQVYVDLNQSESRAILRVKGNGNFRKRIVTLFQVPATGSKSVQAADTRDGTQGAETFGGAVAARRRFGAKTPYAAAEASTGAQKRELDPFAESPKPAKMPCVQSAVTSNDDGGTGGASSLWAASPKSVALTKGAAKCIEATFKPVAPGTTKKS